jgi:hypothetical protein
VYAQWLNWRGVFTRDGNGGARNGDGGARDGGHDGGRGGDQAMEEVLDVLGGWGGDEDGSTGDGGHCNPNS